MSGPREIFRYELIASNGTSTRVCFVEADASAGTLVLENVANLQAALPTSANRLRMEIPIAVTPRGKKARARLVEVEFTEGVPPGRSTRKSWVPVFIAARFSLYEIGQTGTFMGLPVKMTAKLDGSPTVRGQKG